jgi:crotonobetainyl-CoA:carnitine CoA-transferase CaiB-like acyl-CoA transferase
LSVCAALLRARATGLGAQIDLAQADVAAITNWFRIEGTRAYERPADEVTGNAADGGVRREPGITGMQGSVRYQYYRTADGYVLLMASEQEFWRNFCEAVGRMDLFDSRPGSQYADHARGDRALQAELQSLFQTRTTADWVRLGNAANCPIARVNDAGSIASDPSFAQRLPWLPASDYGTDLLPSPVNLVGEGRAPSRPAPRPGQHTQEVLREVLGASDERLAELGAAGAIPAESVAAE